MRYFTPVVFTRVFCGQIESGGVGKILIGDL
jgi:hypothetical protein